MPSNQGKQPGLSMASLGTQGPGVQGPSAAMRALQDMAAMNQQHVQKAALNVQRMQQEQDARMQAAQQQQQNGMADIANQVAGGLGKMYDERRQRQEKVENVQLQEDMMEFQQKQAQDAQAEGQRIGTMLKNAQQASMSAIEVWKQKGDQMRININAAHSVFDEMLQNKKFADIPGGYQKAEDIWRTLKSAEAYHEDAFNPAYLSHATRLLADAERDIVEGRDPVDLAAYYDEQSPSTKDYQSVSPIGMNDKVDGRTRFQMSLRDGYPKEGIYAMPEDDPRRAHMKIVTPDVMAKLLIDDASYSSLVTEESRDKWMKFRLKEINDNVSKMEKMSTSYEQVSDMMFSRSPDAIRRGLSNFTANPATGKFASPQEGVVNSILMEMFPESGDQIIKLAQGVRDRSIELDTPAEFGSAMTLEAAASAIESRVMTILASDAGQLSSDKGGRPSSQISQLAEQWAQYSGPANVMQTLGGDSVDKYGSLTGPGLAKAQLHVQGMLEQAKTYAGELRRSLNESGAISQFSKQFGTEMKVGDIYLWKWLNSNADNKDKAKELLYGEAKKGLEEEARNLSLADLQNVEVARTPELDKSRGIIDSTLEYLQAVQPSQLPLAASILSGGQVDLTDGRVPQFNVATQTATERSDYLQLVQQQLKDHREMAKMAKEARETGAPLTPQEAHGERARRQSARAQFAEKVRIAKAAGGGGTQGRFNVGMMTLRELGREAITGLTGQKGAATGYNYGE